MTDPYAAFSDPVTPPFAPPVAPPRQSRRRARVQQYQGELPTDVNAVFPALVAQESGGRAGVLGPMTRYGQAIGRTQMLPATAREMAQRVGVPFDESMLRGTTPEDAAYQDRLGLEYLKQGYEQTGNMRDALRYYHGGPNRNIWGPKTEAYSEEVLSRLGTGRVADVLLTSAASSPSYGQETDWDAFSDPVADSPAPDTGYKLPDGVSDWTTLSPEAQRALGAGDRVLLPAETPGAARQIVTLRGSPFREETRAGDRVVDGINLREPNLRDTAEAFTTAYTEQIPFLDEAVAGATAIRDDVSFSEARGRQRTGNRLLNETNRGARVAGGLSGFGATLAIPGISGAGYIGRGATGLDRAARGATVGAGTGAVFGAGAADGGLQERGMGAAVGGLTGYGAGATLTAAAPYAAGLAARVGSGSSEAVETVLRGLGRRTADPAITPRNTDAATSYVQRLVEGSGNDLAGNPVAAMGKPITAAEAIGPSGIGNMVALSRRSGRTGQAATTQLGARQAETAQRVVQDFADLTGMDPAGSADMIQNLATAGRARAAPFYEALYEQPAPITPQIERLLRRPVARAALRRAYRLAANEDIVPEEIGLSIMTVDDGLPGGLGPVSRDPELMADLDALRAGTRTQGAARGDSLLSFISKSGGVRDDGGELAQIGADTWNRQGSWRRRAVKPDGLSLEEMADRARAAGYFPEIVDATADGSENYQRLSSQDMIDAIEAELRGRPRFARAPEDTVRGADAPLRQARRLALDERLTREGVDISKVDNAEAARILRDADDADARAMAFLDGESAGEPAVALVPGEVPTMRTMDYVKRGLDLVLDSYRDRTTGRLIVNDDSRPVINTLTELREALVAGTGGDEGLYARALSAGGDPIRLESAFKDAPKLFQTGISFRDFTTATRRMGEAERNALVAGFANKLFTDAEAGRITPRQLDQLQLPVTRQKLEALMGGDRAQSFIERLSAEAGMARSGPRMAFGNNSTTFEAMEAAREQDAGVPAVNALANRISQNGPIGGTIQAALEGLYAPIGGFVRGAASPADRATRDEIGRLLMMSPGELEAILAQARAAAGSTTQAPGGAVERALRGATVQSTGRASGASVQGDAQRSRRAGQR